VVTYARLQVGAKIWISLPGPAPLKAIRCCDKRDCDANSSTLSTGMEHLQARMK
jgi:hypothetical protein